MDTDGILTLVGSLPGVVGVALVGSCAKGAADEFSDVDVVVTCAPEEKARLWARRDVMFSAIGKVMTVVDINDIVPYSTIAFLEKHARVHIEFICAEDCTCSSHAEPDLPNVMDASRLIFWLNRLIVGLGRSERATMLEAQLRCAEFFALADSLRWGRDFRGFKGLANQTESRVVSMVDSDRRSWDVTGFVRVMRETTVLLNGNGCRGWSNLEAISAIHSLLKNMEEAAHGS